MDISSVTGCPELATIFNLPALKCSCSSPCAPANLAYLSVIAHAPESAKRFNASRAGRLGDRKASAMRIAERIRDEQILSGQMATATP